jgi:hypothetical protein
MGDPARITVSRQMEIDIRQRQVVLSLDDCPLATLLYGQSVSRDLEAGHHRLKAHNTLVWKTLEFDLEPGQHARFATANRNGIGSWLVYLLGAGPIYVTLERETAT